MAELRASVCFLGGLILALASFAASGEPADAPGAAATIASLAVPFVPNVGQWSDRTAFAAHTFGGMLAVTRNGRLIYGPGGDAVAAARRTDRAAGDASRNAAPPAARLVETFVDGAGRPIRAQPRGAHAAVTKVSYFIGGDPRKYASASRTYERLDLGQVFPGIRVELRATGANVEKAFTVAPHRDESRIRVRVDGAASLEVGTDGALIARTPRGPVVFTAPVAYQEGEDGRRQGVEVRYELRRGHSYGFRAGPHDRRRALVIDPLLQSTYLGASGDEQITAIAIHPASGEVYVTGYTTSSGSTFPGVLAPGAGAQGSYGGGAHDVFVSRFNADLTSLLQSTYLGDAGDDQGLDIAIHPATGEIYVAGKTNSGPSTFPGVAGGAQSTIGSFSTSGFVSRFDATLTTLLQSTYLSGSLDSAQANAIAVHPANGDIYVAGTTIASNFPGVAGGAQSAINSGGTDGFVTRLDPTLTAIVQSTYLGGHGPDAIVALAIHPANGQVYVAGNTSTTDLAWATGGAQPTRAGGQDAFVSTLASDLQTPGQSTYLGTITEEILYALGIHPGTGEVYVAGTTTSMSFPGVAGGAIPGPLGGGLYKSFVSRFDPPLHTLLQSTYLGGSTTDQATALAIRGATGEVYVAGNTNSTNFPHTVSAAQSTYGGGSDDGFASRFNAALTVLEQSTYFGGLGFDQVFALALQPSTGEVYMGGFTNGGLPGTTGGAQPDFGGGNRDGILSRHTPDLTDSAAPGCPYTLSPLALANVTAAGGSFNVAVTTPSGCPVTSAVYQPWVSVASTVVNGGTVTVQLNVASNAGAPPRATSIRIADRLFLVTQQGP